MQVAVSGQLMSVNTIQGCNEFSGAVFVSPHKLCSLDFWVVQPTHFKPLTPDTSSGLSLQSWKRVMVCKNEVVSSSRSRTWPPSNKQICKLRTQKHPVDHHTKPNYFQKRAKFKPYCWMYNGLLLTYFTLSHLWSYILTVYRPVVKQQPNKNNHYCLAVLRGKCLSGRPVGLHLYYLLPSSSPPRAASSDWCEAISWLLIFFFLASCVSHLLPSHKSTGSETARRCRRIFWGTFSNQCTASDLNTSRMHNE